MKRIANEVGGYSFLCVTQGVLHHAIRHELFPVYKPPTFPLSPSFSFFHIDTSVLRSTQSMIVDGCYLLLPPSIVHDESDFEPSFMISPSLSNAVPHRQ